MRRALVDVYIVHVTNGRGWRVLIEVHKRYSNWHSSADISVYLPAVGAEAFPSHHCCVLITLFCSVKIDCRGWASLDMSFKTPMLSCCSIFIPLQVCNRPSGQHIVSLAVNSAVDQTYVVDRGNMKPPACHPALFLLYHFLLSSLLSSTLLTLPLDACIFFII